MSNLIVTVISIALVAIAALVGAWYGAEAFMNGQARARGNQIIKGAEQVAAAWRLYAADNHGNSSLVDTVWNDGTADDLVPNYLSEWPRYRWPGNAAEPYFRLVKLGAGSDPYDTIYYGPIYNKQTCEQINLIATGTASVSATPEVNAVVLTKAQPIYCKTSDPGNGNPYYYYFYYRVF